MTAFFAGGQKKGREKAAVEGWCQPPRIGGDPWVCRVSAAGLLSGQQDPSSQGWRERLGMVMFIDTKAEAGSRLGVGPPRSCVASLTRGPCSWADRPVYRS